MNDKLENTFNEYLTEINRDIKNTKELIKDIPNFTITELSIPIDSINDYRFKHVLYYFEIPYNLSSQKICEVIDNEKNREKSKDEEFKLPRVNFKNAEIAHNKILYVGKSSGYFSTRLKQHIGVGSKSTYALHLKEWGRLFKKEIKLKLHYVSLENKLNESNKHLLELLETSLHYKFKPILGRTGH